MLTDDSVDPIAKEEQLEDDLEAGPNILILCTSNDQMPNLKKRFPTKSSNQHLQPLKYGLGKWRSF